MGYSSKGKVCLSTNSPGTLSSWGLLKGCPVWFEEEEDDLDEKKSSKGLLVAEEVDFRLRSTDRWLELMVAENEIRRARTGKYG